MVPCHYFAELIDWCYRALFKLPSFLYKTDIHNEPGHGRPNFPYSQDIGPFVSGLSQPLFPNVLLPTSVSETIILLCIPVG